MENKKSTKSPEELNDQEWAELRQLLRDGVEEGMEQAEVPTAPAAS